MAVGPLLLDFELTCSPLTVSLPPICMLLRNQNLTIFAKGIPEDVGFETSSNRPAKVCWGQGQASPEELPECFSDATHRWCKKPQSHPHSTTCKESKHALWLSDWYEPWVDWQLWRPPGSGSTSGRGGEYESDLDVGTCRKLCEDGHVTEAVNALDLLVQRGFHIPDKLFYRLLKSCIAQKDLGLGRRIHALTVESGYEGNAFLATHLIGMYASQGRLKEAMQVFTNVTAPSTYNWASIIFACAKHGEPTQAIRLYRQMRESTVKPDNRIFVAVLKACARAGDLGAGKDVHAYLLASAAKPDMFVQNSLVDMYAKCGSLEDARRVFDRLADRDVVTWTAMISGYAQQGMGHEALHLYTCMQQQGITLTSSVTFVCLLQACASLGAAGLHQGKQLHARLEELDMQGDVCVSASLSASLITMYSKCGSLEDARRVFDRLFHKDVVIWTAMISGYAQQGRGAEALSLYLDMQQAGSTPPNSVTFVCLLQACASVGEAALEQGKKLHAQIELRQLQSDVLIGNSLVNMYAKCGSLEDAHSVFHKLRQKDVVSWTAMIAGHVQQGLCEEALALYTSMNQEGITSPNCVTFACLLQACANVAALPLGKQLHTQIKERGYEADVAVGSSLVNMYAKCGSLEDAKQVFDSLAQREIVAWSALIAGYARQGDSEAVFELVDRMQLEGVEPNGVTFLSALTVCSHVGLVDKGQKYFEAMCRDHGITPTIEHYRCMVDLLGRAGHLQKALRMVKTMPFQPDRAVWLTLLGACRKWCDVEVGLQVFESAVRLDETDSAPYVLMSNIYLGAQMWEEAKEMQARRDTLGAWKQPGQSWWTDMDGAMHSFVVGD